MSGVKPQCDENPGAAAEGDLRYEALLGLLIGQRSAERSRAQAEAEFSSKQAELKAAQDSYSELQSRFSQAVARIRDSTALVNALKAEITKISAGSERFQIEMTAKCAAYEKALTHERTLRTQIQDHSAQKAREQATEADRLRGRIARAEEDLTRKTNEAFQLRSSLESSQLRISAVTQEMTQLRACFETASQSQEAAWEERLRSKTQELHTLEELLTRTQAQFQAATEADASTRAKLESQLAGLQECFVELECELSLLRENEKKAQASAASEAARAEAAEGFLKRSEAEIARLRNDLAQAMAFVEERSGLERKLRETEERFAQTLGAQGELRVSLVQARSEIESLRTSLSDANGWSKELERELEELQSSPQSEIVTLPEEVTTALAAFDEAQQQIEAERSAKQGMESELNALRAELSEARAAARKSSDWARELKTVAQGLAKELKPGSPSARKFSLLSDLCAGEEEFFAKGDSKT